MNFDPCLHLFSGAPKLAQAGSKYNLKLEDIRSFRPQGGILIGPGEAVVAVKQSSRFVLIFYLNAYISRRPVPPKVTSLLFDGVAINENDLAAFRFTHNSSARCISFSHSFKLFFNRGFFR
jgi:hypothetical protein